MSVGFAITGGYLEIDKGVFTKEMLRKDSRLRKLLNTGDLAQKAQIIKNESNRTYTVDFNHSSDIEVDETYQELFRSLKADYRGNIKGKVTIRVTSYHTFFTVVNLNSEDGLDTE